MRSRPVAPLNWAATSTRVRTSGPNTWYRIRAATAIVQPTRGPTAWTVDKQAEALLPIPYLHLVFTPPIELNALIQYNQAELYDLLFAAASATLIEYGRSRLQARIGVRAVMHTLSQTFLEHHHIHCIVTRRPVSPFQHKTDEVLSGVSIDAIVEERCAPFYKEGGRPSTPLGVSFRMVFIGSFEIVDSQRGIAWRCAANLALRTFLGQT